MYKKWIQKTSAVILLVLFIFIHAVKVFHTHDFHYSASANNKNATIVKTAFACAICDFQIAKDSDATISNIHITAPVTLISVHYNYLLPVATSFAIASDNKGPPFIA